MYAVIAVTINRSFAPIGKSAGQWAKSEGWFVFNQSNRALVANRGTKGAVCHWYGRSALPLQDITYPVFKNRRKKVCRVWVEKAPHSWAVVWEGGHILNICICIYAYIRVYIGTCGPQVPRGIGVSVTKGLKPLLKEQKAQTCYNSRSQ